MPCAALRQLQHKLAWKAALSPRHRRVIADRANAAERIRYRKQNPIPRRKCESCARTFEVKSGYRRRFCPTHSALRITIKQRIYARRRMGWSEGSLRRAKAA